MFKTIQTLKDPKCSLSSNTEVRDGTLTSSVALLIHRSSSASPDLTYSPLENVQHSRRNRRLKIETNIYMKDIK